MKNITPFYVFFKIDIQHLIYGIKVTDNMLKCYSIKQINRKKVKQFPKKNIFSAKLKTLRIYSLGITEPLTQKDKKSMSKFFY